MRARLLAAACVLLAGIVTAGCGAGGAISTSTAVAPPVSASPQTVVRAWVDAVNAGDEAAGRVLSTPVFAGADRDAGEAGWFANVLGIRDLQVGAPSPVTGLASNERFAQVVLVPVAFTLEQKRELAFRDGPVQWGFVLVRDRAGQRWRINEQGLG